MVRGTETTFGGLTPGTWDDLAGGRFYSRSKWLTFCTEETGTPGHAVVVGNDASACAVPIRELAGLPDWSRYRWNDHLTEAGLPLLPSGGLLVGPPEGFQTHFLGAGAASTGHLKELIGELRRQCGGQAGRACVAMFLDTDGVI